MTTCDSYLSMTVTTQNQLLWQQAQIATQMISQAQMNEYTYDVKMTGY